MNFAGLPIIFYALPQAKFLFSPLKSNTALATSKTAGGGLARDLSS
jgi:hypothetical protein